MRNVEPKVISVQQWNSYWGILGFPSAPTIDGVFLPEHPLDMLKKGDFPETEIMIGSNLDEGKIHHYHHHENSLQTFQTVSTHSFNVIKLSI